MARESGPFSVEHQCMDGPVCESDVPRADRFPATGEDGPALFRMGVGKHLREYEHNRIHHFSDDSWTGWLAPRGPSWNNVIYFKLARSSISVFKLLYKF